MRRRKGSQRNQQLSDEELQRTQVLNLQDFKETARIERISSKKPAVIVALLGVCLIAIGLTFPAMQSLAARRSAEKSKQEIEQRKQDIVEVKVEKATCHFESLNNPNGTDENINITYTFEDNKLIASTKAYILTKSATATSEPAELSSYLAALQSFLIRLDGYNVSVQTVSNGSITTTEVDYKKVDLTQIPAAHQSNYRFNVLFEKDATKEDVMLGMANAGYRCE